MPSLRVFICSLELPQSGYRVVASCYDEFRTLLMENFECLQRGNFVITEREDGTLISDDDYFQFLRPETELLVLIEKEIPTNAGLPYGLHLKHVGILVPRRRVEESFPPRGLDTRSTFCVIAASAHAQYLTFCTETTSQLSHKLLLGIAF